MLNMNLKFNGQATLNDFIPSYSDPLCAFYPLEYLTKKHRFP